MQISQKKRIAIIGGGPSALFVYKRLVEARRTDLSVHIYERKQHLGQGMPYSSEGARPEHITNVSGNELPDMSVRLDDWVRALPQKTLDDFNIKRDSFSEDKVLPRLLFGQYLEAQFALFKEQAEKIGLQTTVHLDSHVTDLTDVPENEQIAVSVEGREPEPFDRVVICSGHNWPQQHEGEVEGYYASPYPPSKLARRFNHNIALRGSSLTAVDAMRTLARNNGTFVRDGDTLKFEVAAGSEDFKVIMHTRNGLLPCVRFHLDDPQVSDEGLLQREEWLQAREENGGFVPLDLIFEKDFKKLLRERDPAFYERIRNMTPEEFGRAAMDPRERTDAFEYFKLECAEARESMEQEKSIVWKEVLAILSFALNYPAKHFSAEDTLRMKAHLTPLISIVIAFIPKGSCEELIALHDAGRLTLISVGDDSRVEVTSENEIVYRYTDDDGQTQSVPYETYIDCVGQPPLRVKDFPFPTLIEQGVVRQARLTFRDESKGQEQQKKDKKSVEQDADGSYHLIVPGIAIDDSFRPLTKAGDANPRVQIMAVPYIGGHNPDYSGLDFCEAASELIVAAMLGREPAPT